jgi:hypothetical protein
MAPLTFSELREQPGLRGVILKLRHYYRRDRSAVDLAEEMWHRMHELTYEEERANLWERWQLGRHQLQYGRHQSAYESPVDDVLIEYYNIKDRHQQAAINPNPPASADGLAAEFRVAPLGPRSRRSPLAEMRSWLAGGDGKKPALRPA